MEQAKSSKNIMAHTILKVKPSLWEANSGDTGSVVGVTSAKKRQKIVETELYKVSRNRSPPYCTRASRATAQAVREGVQASNPPTCSQA